VIKILIICKVFVKKDKKFFCGHTRLAEERRRIFDTQEAAADFFGVTRVTWGQCERGNATPSGDVLAGLAQQGADVLYILTGQRSSGESTITPVEAALLDNFRNCSPDVQKVLRAASSAGAQPAIKSIAA
jgi:DNA-binding XRE family transcriptional regulator